MTEEISDRTYVVPAERPLTGAALRDTDPSPRFRIGEVSERLGLSLRSIRYYEEAGLVTPTARTQGGFRMYAESDVQRLLVVMQMKPLGFTLDRMREVLGDLDDVRDPHNPETVRGEAAARLALLRDEMQSALVALTQRLEIARGFTDRLGEELTDLDVSEAASSR